ncbi:MAG: T9SS type A sorting domain-containing protein [Bacteroidales bacterium]|jgi:hypothetical protein|nr:T9SS type A sorting domain-containing protein [Bacteroidales bacterium]
MKKIFITLVGALAITFAANAQNFQNNGFETWSGNTPANWNGLTLLSMEVAPGSIAKSTDAHSGSYALKLQPANFSSTLLALLQLSGAVPDSILTMLQAVKLPGFVTNGTIDAMGLLTLLADLDMSNPDPALLAQLAQYITDGVAITSMPTSVNGYAKFTPAVSTDNAQVIALCMSGTGDSRTVVGLGTYSATSATNGYQAFTAQIAPLSDVTPTDLVLIAVSLSGDNSSTPVMLLDDLSINFGNGLDNVTMSNEVGIYPNPSNGNFSVNCANGVTLVVTNMLGQEVVTLNNYRSGSPINIAKKGIYFVRIDDGNNRITKKVVVK